MKNTGKILHWIAYAVNMLMALPVFGFISCAIFWLTYQIICDTDPPVWVWCFPGLFAFFLIVLWGRYQYRILILKTPRPARKEAGKTGYGYG